MIIKYICRMVFIFPTETAYGLGCDACNKTSVVRVFKIKGRMANKCVPLIAADLAMAKKYIDGRVWRAPEVQNVLKKFWPGAFTLVAPASAYARKNLAPQTLAADKTIAIRVSSNKLARELARTVGAPIVATSANAAGAPAGYSVATVKKSLGQRIKNIDVILNAGVLPKRPPSTIARFVSGQRGQAGEWKIIRFGTIKLPRIKSVR